jgi:hypothetical protein
MTRVFAAWIIVAGLVSGPARGGDDTGSLLSRLQAPMVSVIEDGPLRPTLEQIAERAGINLWVDRRIDPTAAVKAGQVGPTVYASLRQLASRRGAEVFPVNNVLLVGRPDWLNRTGGSLLRLSGGEVVDVRWDRLTTPSEALRIASGGVSPGPGFDPLPHDLWPAVSWSRVSRATAVTLVLAQFDRRLRKDPGSGPLRSFDSSLANARGRFRRSYNATTAATSLERAVGRVDSDARVTVRGDRVVVDGSVVAHRAALETVLSHEVPAGGGKPSNAPTFTLNLKNKPAGSVLRQLADAAGKKCRIDDAAATACRRLVSLQATDATLRELAIRVAAEVGLDVHWGPATVEVVVPQQPGE